VRYVAKEFFRHYVAMNSLLVEYDLADAWNRMTPELRAAEERGLAEFQKKEGQEFVAYVKKQGIQTELEFDDKRTDVAEHDGRAFTVHLRGIANTWPVGHVGEAESTSSKEFDAFITLVRCPRTEQTPNGLLVHKISRRFYNVEPSGADAPRKGE
jgi:hypothetical protein